MLESDSDRTIDSDELNDFMKKNCSRTHSKNLHEVSDDDNELKDSRTSTEDITKKRKTKQETIIDQRPLCKYGAKCYRKNPEHHKQYQHVIKDDFISKKKKYDSDKIHNKNWQETNNFNFFFTTVKGINEKYNQLLALNIKDVLSSSEGKLIASVQFNYMFDIPWLILQYPVESRSCPLLIVHGEQRNAKQKLEYSAKNYPNITFCQVKLEIMYGTHHTKMMILLYENGLRIVIHTSNLIEDDWCQKTQGMWVSPVFPKLIESSMIVGESPTNFKADLYEYLSSYNNSSLNDWCKHIKNHDLSSAKVFLIGSVPGRHIGSRKTSFGHLKLRKILTKNDTPLVMSDWPVIGQFSSIGSLGSNQNQWLCGEWLTSFSMTKGGISAQKNAPLKLIFPTVDNVRCSLEGYPAGGSLPYSNSVASKQPYLKTFLHQWKSVHLGRSQASPHIKSYCRISPNMDKIAWFILTSANLSKAAWGAFEKNGGQLMIRSYELGILFMPKYLCNEEYFAIFGEDNKCKFSLPFDVPLIPYDSSDEPWIWDIPHKEAPDRYGRMWCPPL